MPTPFEDVIVIFTDGACSGNPGPGGWGAIVATPKAQVWEMGGGAPRTTNNQMELAGAIEALASIAEFAGEVFLYTDSVYVIRGITQWIWGWKKKGWVSAEGKGVANRELWEALHSLVVARGKGNAISWKYVRGHTAVPGNERVDEIAVSYSKGVHPNLYRGPLADYAVPIQRIPANTEVPSSQNGSDPGAKSVSLSYLSLIGTIPMRHATWAECERRVKGQSGAKYKKVSSSEEAEAVLRGWGVDPKAVK